MAARLTAFLVAVIVGISVVAGLIVGATREADPAVDVLIYNGRVYTGNPEAPIAEAIAIRGNRILRVGSNREIKRLRRNAGTIIDAHGGSILPGFADTFVELPGQPDAVTGVHRLGLTAVGAVVDDGEYRALVETAGRPDKPLRVAAALRVALPLSDESRASLRARRAESADELVRLDALAYDVTLPEAPPARPAAAGKRAAAPQPPLLNHAHQQGLLELDADGWPLVLRVDDEREMGAALDVVARLIETNPEPETPRRHRLVLAKPMRLDTARLGALGVGVAMPLPATWTGDVAPAPDATAPQASVPAATTAPPEPTGLPFAFPLPEGVRLVMGSEIVADPRLGLHALVTGAVRAPAGRADEAAEDEASDPDTDPADRDVLTDALATVTTEAAQALGAGAEWGTLEAGRLADLVVLSADLFELPAARLLDAVVIATVVDGKLVYDRDTDVPPPTP